MVESEINQFINASTACARDHGFEVTDANLPCHLMLVVTEVAEAMEEWRLDPPDYVKLTTELADVVLRVFNIAGFLDLDLEAAMRAKHEKNLLRPLRHGGKRA